LCSNNNPVTEPLSILIYSNNNCSKVPTLLIFILITHEHGRQRGVNNFAQIHNLPFSLKSPKLFKRLDINLISKGLMQIN
jgi:hypothetical protein